MPPAQAPLAGEYVYFDYEEAPVRNWFTRGYDLVAGRRPGDPEPLAHAGLPLMLSSIPEDELLRLLQHLSERHGFALELAGQPGRQHAPLSRRGKRSKSVWLVY